MSSDAGGHCPQGAWSRGTKRGEARLSREWPSSQRGFSQTRLSGPGPLGVTPRRSWGASPGKTMNKRAGSPIAALAESAFGEVVRA